MRVGRISLIVATILFLLTACQIPWQTPQPQGCDETYNLKYTQGYPPIKHLRVGETKYASQEFLLVDRAGRFMLHQETPMHLCYGPDWSMKVTQTRRGLVVGWPEESTFIPYTTDSIVELTQAIEVRASQKNQELLEIAKVRARGDLTPLVKKCELSHPEHKRQVTISEMQEGDCGYLTPWMLEITQDGRYFLPAAFVLSPTRGGTMDMLVMYTQETGLVVEAPSRYRWTRVDSPRFTFQVANVIFINTYNPMWLY